MLTELLSECRITLPQAIIDKMGLAVGDLLEISERDGVVVIVPVDALNVPERFSDEDEIDRKQMLMELFGSIDDPTFVEPPEIQYESPREPIE